MKSDSDAGLLKVGCRYYDPQLGAFTSRDTELDQVPYLYCEHDPINAVDPSGHESWWAGLNPIEKVAVVFLPLAMIIEVVHGIHTGYEMKHKLDVIDHNKKTWLGSRPDDRHGLPTWSFDPDSEHGSP